MTVAQHAKEAKSASAAIARPGAKAGQASEFTLISKLKPGAAERVRALLADGFTGERQKNTDRIATVHDLRFVIFDNDTRIIFGSTFDGGWEKYIDDFGGIIHDEIDLLFHEFEGDPGRNAPNIKYWISDTPMT